MSQITWRNIDAPDFRTSQRGLAAAIQQLNDSFNTARAGLTRLDNAKTSALNNNILT